MKDMNWLIESYLDYLKNKQSNIRISIEDLLKNDRVDEANLEKIRLNIVDIFSKMFNISMTSNCEARSEDHTSELQSRPHLVCRLLLEKKNTTKKRTPR